MNVVGSVVFAGMSGTAIADAAGLGTIEIKAMREHGYSPEFAVGVTAASATLGPIIPPSLPFVIYGMFANVSVGALFLAGILPGAGDGAPDDGDGRLLRAQQQAGAATSPFEWRARAQGVRRAGGRARAARSRCGCAAQAGANMSWRRADRAGRCCSSPTACSRFSAVLPIMTPVLLIGGMTTGLFTATEGAIAACVWALFLGVVWYRTMSWKMLVKVSMDTIETTATVLLIVAAASIFGWMLTATRTTELIAQWILLVRRRRRGSSCCWPTR